MAKILASISLCAKELANPLSLLLASSCFFTLRFFCLFAYMPFFTLESLEGRSLLGASAFSLFEESAPLFSSNHLEGLLSSTAVTSAISMSLVGYIKGSPVSLEIAQEAFMINLGQVICSNMYQSFIDASLSSAAHPGLLASFYSASSLFFTFAILDFDFPILFAGLLSSTASSLSQTFFHGIDALCEEDLYHQTIQDALKAIQWASPILAPTIQALVLMSSSTEEDFPFLLTRDSPFQEMPMLKYTSAVTFYLGQSFVGFYNLAITYLSNKEASQPLSTA